MPYVDILLDNRISCSFIETNELENVIFCRPLEESLNNVSLIQTKDAEFIHNYLEESAGNYLVSDITLDNGTVYSDVRFKMVTIEEGRELPVSTINLSTLGIPSSTDSIPSVQLLEEDYNHIPESVEEEEDDFSVLYETTKIDNASEIIQKVKRLENKLIEEQEKINQEKVRLDEERITLDADRRLQKTLEDYKSELLQETFLVSEHQKEILEKTINSLGSSLQEQFDSQQINVGKYLDEISIANLDELKKYQDSQVSKIKGEITTLLSEHKDLSQEEINKQLLVHTDELEKLLAQKLTLELESHKRELSQEVTSITTAVDKLVEEKLKIESQNIDKLLVDRSGNLQSKFSEDIDSKLEENKKSLFKEFESVSTTTASTLFSSKTEELNNALESVINEHRQGLNDTVNQKLNEVSSTVSKFTADIDGKLPQLEDTIKDINKRIQNLVIEKKNVQLVVDDARKYTDTKVAQVSEEVMNYARRILDLGGGGGSNAVQYANGGTMNGDLNVTGQYLSGGVSLFNILSGSGGGAGNPDVNALVISTSANWNSAYASTTALNLSSNNWNSAYNIATAYQGISGSFVSLGSNDEYFPIIILDTNQNLQNKRFIQTGTNAYGAIYATSGSLQYGDPPVWEFDIIVRPNNPDQLLWRYSRLDAQDDNPPIRTPLYYAVYLSGEAIFSLFGPWYTTTSLNDEVSSSIFQVDFYSPYAGFPATDYIGSAGTSTYASRSDHTHPLPSLQQIGATSQTDFNNYRTSVAASTATLLPTTVYSSASGSFATNTLLQSTSALLTPLTLTRTLTSQLVLNTAINSLTGNWNSAYASTTALNLSSGNWNSAYTTTVSNSGIWSVKDRLNNGTVQVVLSSDNNLYFPTGTIGDTLQDGGFTIVGKPGSYAEIASNDGNVFAWASDTNYGNPVGGGFSIGTDTTTVTGGYVWTFGNDGLLRFPDGTIQPTAFTNNLDSYASLNYVNTNFFNLTGGTISGATRINNNLTVFGNLTATGTTTFANTIFSVTSSLSVVHIGSGPALYIGNSGDGDIASFYDIDQGIEVFHVGGNNGSHPNVGVKTSTPNVDFTVNGQISANNTIWSANGNSNNWNTSYASTTALNLSSGRWNSAYSYVNSTSASISNCLAYDIPNSIPYATNGFILNNIVAKSGSNSLSERVISCQTYGNNVITGGSSNTINSTNCSVIAGGKCNSIRPSNYGYYSDYSIIGSGCYNDIQGACYSFIGGGCLNCVGGTVSKFSSVVGGACNTVSGYYSSVAGGYCNTASGNHSNVAGGAGNTASGNFSTVSSGYRNTASGYISNVAGGLCNIASGCVSNVAGGCLNTICTIGTGISNTGSTSILGGTSNNISSTSSGYYDGGLGQCIQSSSNVNNSAILGGSGNVIADCNLVYNTSTSSGYSTIIGGNTNRINNNSPYNLIGGGLSNQIFGSYNAIVGGQNNSLSGTNNFTLGSNISVSANNYTFVNNLSSQGIVAAQGGNSNNWNSAYASTTALNLSSNSWNSLKTEAATMQIELPDNKDYILDARSSYLYTLSAIHFYSLSGTGNLTLKINNVVIPEFNQRTISNSLSTVYLTTNNIVSSNQTFTASVSNNAYLLDLILEAVYIR